MRGKDFKKLGNNDFNTSKYHGLPDGEKKPLVVPFLAAQINGRICVCRFMIIVKLYAVAL